MSDMVTKSFGTFEIKSEERGEVEAVVATLGVVDRDGDVILPGAFKPNKVRLSYYGHDILLDNAPPVGMGTIVEDGDRAIFKGRFFLNTTRGREAFETVKALGPDGEWSFGFPNGTARKGEVTDEWSEKGARRVITELHAMEASPVLMPAGYGTGTLAVKSADVNAFLATLADALKQTGAAPEPAAEVEPEPTAEEAVEDVVAEPAAPEVIEAKQGEQEDEQAAALKAVNDEALRQFERFQRTMRRLAA